MEAKIENNGSRNANLGDNQLAMRNSEPESSRFSERWQNWALEVGLNGETTQPETSLLFRFGTDRLTELVSSRTSPSSRALGPACQSPRVFSVSSHIPAVISPGGPDSVIVGTPTVVLVHGGVCTSVMRIIILMPRVSVSTACRIDFAEDTGIQSKSTITFLYPHERLPQMMDITPTYRQSRMVPWTMDLLVRKRPIAHGLALEPNPPHNIHARGTR
ncbi:hypothetical protein B0H19DRAFT_1072593 [Mycena capillaripes]|nr:hypothetical protein B0H19DRAFT_1072593 [Mycena capillaripes]